MEHLTDEQIYDLAKKLLTGEHLSAEDVEAIKHIEGCSECYKMMMCTLSMMGVASNLSLFAKPISLP